MRKFFVSLLLTLPSSLIQADESLQDFGLSGLVQLPAAAGDLVRGTGYSSGLSSISLFVYSPVNGSSLNANASSMSVGHSGAATQAGFTPSLTGSLGGLSFNFSGSVFTFGANYGSANFNGSEHGFCDGSNVSPNPGGQTGNPPSGGGNGNPGNNSNGQGLGLTQGYGWGNNF